MPTTLSDILRTTWAYSPFVAFNLVELYWMILGSEAPVSTVGDTLLWLSPLLGSIVGSFFCFVCLSVLVQDDVYKKKYATSRFYFIASALCGSCLLIAATYGTGNIIYGLFSRLKPYDPKDFDTAVVWVIVFFITGVILVLYAVVCIGLCAAVAENYSSAEKVKQTWG